MNPTYSVIPRDDIKPGRSALRFFLEIGIIVALLGLFIVIFPTNAIKAAIKNLFNSFSKFLDNEPQTGLYTGTKSIDITTKILRSRSKRGK